MDAKESYGGHIVVAGDNYAQGSSREHAAIAPRYLGQVAVLAKSYARLGWQNLINFGIIPFEFADSRDYDTIEQGDIIRLENLISTFENEGTHYVLNKTKNIRYELKHRLSKRQVDVLLKGGVINYFSMKSKKSSSVKDTIGSGEL